MEYQNCNDEFQDPTDSISSWIDKIKSTGAVPYSELEASSPNPNSWSSPSSSQFHVRGPNYFSDKLKIPSNSSLLKPLGFDWLKGPAKISEVLKNPNHRIRKTLDEIPGPKPFIWAFNLQLPGKENYSAIMYFISAETGRTDPLVLRFLNSDDSFKNSRLKLIANIVKAPWIVRTAVGEKAICILGRALNCKFHTGSETDLNGSEPNLNYKSEPNLNRSEPNLNGSESGLNGSASGINRSESGLNGSESGFNGPVSGLNGSESGLNGSESGLNGSGSGQNGCGAGFFEVDVDIGSSIVANAVVHLAFGYIKSLTVDLAFLIEAQTADELPERVLGATRFAELDPGSAQIYHKDSEANRSNIGTRLWKSFFHGNNNNNNVSESESERGSGSNAGLKDAGLKSVVNGE